jgi:KaiC
MAKVLGLKQIMEKKHKTLEGLDERIRGCFGDLVEGFIMIVWGQSGSGKSNFLLQFLVALLQYGKVLYVGLEEGFEASMQRKIVMHLDKDAHSGKIEFADHRMTYELLIERLKRKKSAKWIIIDSVQYWDINYAKYKHLKEMFPGKGFIFISHASGKNPAGTTADKIRYDAGIKVRVEGGVAFPISRYGGNKPYLIWEEGAKKYYGRKLKKILNG